MNPQLSDDQNLITGQELQQSAASTGLPVLSQAPPLSSTPAILAPPVPVHPVAPTDASQPQNTAPAEAADADVIEKEWVVKAKEIVAATKDDPYKQVQEINKLKADYMKKRYDKEVKLADE